MATDGIPTSVVMFKEGKGEEEMKKLSRQQRRLERQNGQGRRWEVSVGVILIEMVKILILYGSINFNILRVI